MEKEFVPYELAVKLKALGFTQDFFNDGIWYYATLSTGEIKYFCWTSNEDEPPKMYNPIIRPTISQAFRWFREKNYYVTINTYHSVSLDKPFGLSIDYLHESGIWDYRGESDFETHEEAELACLSKLIEIVETRTK